MITTKDFPDKQFASKEELFKALRENKKALKTTKTISIKHSDAFGYSVNLSSKDGADKSFSNKAEEDRNIDKAIVKFVVNSCGWFDSHYDVHLNGCWNKTASENKNFVHLQEHRATFDGVISQNVDTSIEKIMIQGVKVDALVATSFMERKDNPKMFDRYMEDKVKEHSVGMQYIWDKLYLCIDSNHEDDKEEKENWDKYIDQVVNQEDVKNAGYFWAVAEAKAREGSAVVFGSNTQTPVLEVVENKEPTEVTQNKEPLNNTLASMFKNLEIKN